MQQLQGPKKAKKGWLIVIVVLVLAAAVYFGRGMFQGGEQQQQGGFGVPVETLTVAPRALDMTIDSVGTLVANESVTLRPEVAGRITEIGFTEGQPIEKGQKLFQIDDRMARAELKQAESNLKLARLNYDRFRKLSSTGAATKLRYDEAQAELGVNQANADLARTKVDYSRITAPFDGVVGLRNVSPGDYVNVGQDLANFVSYDPMKVNFTIPETQMSKLQVGQEIDITVEAVPGETFRGKVYALDPQLDVGGRAVALRATIPNQDNKLKPGFFARVQLILERNENAIVVPENAIVPQGNQKYVYVVQADDTVQLVPVTLGQRLQGEVEVVEGVKAGDVIVTSGQIKLGPGAKITKLPPKPAEGAAPGEPASPETPAAEPAPAAETMPAEPTTLPDVPAPQEELQPSLLEISPGEGDAPMPDEGEAAQ